MPAQDVGVLQRMVMAMRQAMQTTENAIRRTNQRIDSLIETVHQLQIQVGELQRGATETVARGKKGPKSTKE